jgi:hypothetical protein
MLGLRGFFQMHGMQDVIGSTPISSTSSSRYLAINCHLGAGHRPLAREGGNLASKISVTRGIPVYYGGRS